MSESPAADHPLAEPRKLGDLLDYQEGSVVSRTLIKKATGTVTVFAFDKGEALSERLGLSNERQVVAFQSRLGRTRWLGPYLEDQLRELPARGIKQAVLISPSFVADCLETLEELRGRAVELFLRSGGQRLDVVESLNASEGWVKAAAEIAQQASTWL